jgi:hypothetical protein
MYSFVHSKTRNRLGIDNVAKLAFCYSILKKEKMSYDVESSAKFD